MSVSDSVETIGISYQASICLTKKVKRDNSGLLPENTIWFDAYIEFDKMDCDEERIALTFKLRPHIGDECEEGKEIRIFLGFYEKNELRSIMQRITNII